MKKRSKILEFEKAPAVMKKLRDSGKKIIQCHGTFDLIHPGHIIHFEEAKALGNVLVVTVTGEKFVNKGPGRPYFNDQLRVKSIASLEIVDYVVIIPYPAAVEAIECIKPDFYCKGKEYENPGNDPTGNIHDDIKTVERLGGKVVYLGDVVFSSTSLLNSHFDTYSPEIKDFCLKLASKYSAEDFRDAADSFSKLRVLVVGDIIFDRYTTVEIQGLTSKNMIMSGRYLEDSFQAGGALAVFRHIREFTENVKLVSLVGTESWLDEKLRAHINPHEDEILRIKDFSTVVKQRYVGPLKEGKELLKFFSVNYIDAEHPVGKVQDFLCEKVEAQIGDYDLVMVMDFGHGVMGEKLRELIQEKAPFMSLNCQTNSNNFGFNVINRRYTRCDSFSLDQREINLASGKKNPDFMKELKALKDFFKSRYAWLTRGAVETVGLHASAASCVCPSLEPSVVDTIGAGDAFSALASMAAVSGYDVDLATFMGQLAGAEAVKIVGNAEPVRKNRFIKGGMAMLNF